MGPVSSVDTEPGEPAAAFPWASADAGEAAAAFPWASADAGEPAAAFPQASPDAGEPAAALSDRIGRFPRTKADALEPAAAFSGLNPAAGGAAPALPRPNAAAGEPAGALPRENADAGPAAARFLGVAGARRETNGSGPRRKRSSVPEQGKPSTFRRQRNGSTGGVGAGRNPVACCSAPFVLRTRHHANRVGDEASR